MLGRILPVSLVALAAMLAATTTAALAANQTVELDHDAFLPPRVAVKPGETVTWNNSHTEDEHNVHFEDHSFISPNPPQIGPWTASRQFPTEGAYPYYCEIHGRPGGVGMAGTVYVNSTGTTPPSAQLGVPSVARVGEAIPFSGASSTPGTGGAIVNYEWDLDGDGTYELDTDSTPSTTRSYASPTSITVRLRVTDAAGLSSEATAPLRVTAAPTASFTASPNPAQTGQTVTFNGSTSIDSDGTIARYEWDLDGDGSFETDTAATPTASRAYLTAGAVSVKLRVTDDAGVSSETTQPLQVDPASQPAPTPHPKPPAATPPSTTPTPTAPVACSSLTGASRAACMQRACARLSGARRASCLQRSCRYVSRRKRASCVRKSCRYVSRGKRASCMRKSCRWLKGSARRACLRKYTRRR